MNAFIVLREQPAGRRLTAFQRLIEVNAVVWLPSNDAILAKFVIQNLLMV